MMISRDRLASVADLISEYLASEADCIRSEIRALKRTQKTKQEELRLIEEVIGSSSRFLGEQIRQIEKLADVLDVQIETETEYFYGDEPALVVSTKRLITDNEVDAYGRRVLGAYRIIINMFKPLADILVRPLDRFYSFGGRWHPHVGGDGRICYGNASDHVFEVARRYEFAALVQFIIFFLKNPNPEDDWGRDVTRWPIDEEGATITLCDYCSRPVDECECCETCGFSPCECCTTCANYPCSCCETCWNDPCTCCRKCNLPPERCTCEEEVA